MFFRLCERAYLIINSFLHYLVECVFLGGNLVDDAISFRVDCVGCGSDFVQE